MNDRKMVKKVYRKPRSVRNGGRSQWMVMYDVKKNKSSDSIMNQSFMRSDRLELSSDCSH